MAFPFSRELVEEAKVGKGVFALVRNPSRTFFIKLPLTLVASFGAVDSILVENVDSASVSKKKKNA